jgi:LacI family transcriptional regulator
MQKKVSGKKQQRQRKPGRHVAPESHSKTTTINDVARLSGVSKKTVSRVINESPFVKPETRLRVEEVIKSMSYKPNPQARGLAFRKSFLIGLIYDNPNAEYVMNCLEGALEALRDSGFELIVHPCNRRSPEFLAGVKNFVERQKLHGVILLPPISENLAILQILAERNCPHVSVASVKMDAATYRVVSNDRDACAEAVEHLADLGHKRIAVITGPASHSSSAQRLSGFVEGLTRRGIMVPPEFIVSGGYTFESGIQAAEALLSLPSRPTAIFASNDEMAAGVYEAAHRAGVAIPEQLSVVGFDDSPIASRIWPPLTTIRLPIRSMAQLAATQLVNSSIGSEGQDTAFVVAHLIARKSTQAPAARETAIIT